ncbi:hypothetical protein VP01_1053g1 [Puccinia sorghi]|uniref:Uncharacterized protein n=1 Tax=Puccinia sorghi TaxID=27349 RepID=A0A0L6VU62_9BASI|nr:hypothetical protein VP01_1053g1 [Puccinia sorghi]
MQFFSFNRPTTQHPLRISAMLPQKQIQELSLTQYSTFSILRDKRKNGQQSRRNPNIRQKSFPTLWTPLYQPFSHPSRNFTFAQLFSHDNRNCENSQLNIFTHHYFCSQTFLCTFPSFWKIPYCSPLPISNFLCAKRPACHTIKDPLSELFISIMFPVLVIAMRLTEMSSPIRMLQCHIPPCDILVLVRIWEYLTCRVAWVYLLVAVGSHGQGSWVWGRGGVIQGSVQGSRVNGGDLLLGWPQSIGWQEWAGQLVGGSRWKVAMGIRWDGGGEEAMSVEMGIRFACGWQVELMRKKTPSSCAVGNQTPPSAGMIVLTFEYLGLIPTLFRKIELLVQCYFNGYLSVIFWLVEFLVCIVQTSFSRRKGMLTVSGSKFQLILQKCFKWNFLLG